MAVSLEMENVRLRQEKDRLLLHIATLNDAAAEQRAEIERLKAEKRRPKNYEQLRDMAAYIREQEAEIEQLRALLAEAVCPNWLRDFSHTKSTCDWCKRAGRVKDE